ncbi:hypothetical protein FIBSPDRAFT_1053121 [Athelia psychrophila]|uniref:Uncharacterized protein n=1 Tax=Athelia psychrophila TaxID=1759441 RepID=A0A167XFP6_9AGAM|nr:hypothetical protein FIBSPDRAFT_1053121 [Fibularhizoctonia sp. CBS 109695]
MLFQYEMKTFFVVLFFGTGDQTPSIPSAILERVFMDPNKHAPRNFLNSLPFSLPRLTSIPPCACSPAFRSSMKLGNAKWGTVKTWDMVWSRATQGTDNDSQVAGGDTKGEGVVEKKHVNWKERRVLGDVKDVSVTHGDARYTNEYARLKYDAALRSAAREEDRKAQKSFKLAQRNFVLLYFIRSYLSDKIQVQMSWI